MIRLFIILSLLFSISLAKSSVDSDIKKANKKINSFSKNYTKLNKKMSITAKAILKQKKAILKDKKYLQMIKKELAKKEGNYSTNNKRLKTLSKAQSSLKAIQDSLEEKLLFTVSKSISLEIVIQEESAINEQSLIQLEVLKSMLKDSKRKVTKLNRDFYLTSKKMNRLNRKASVLEVDIANIDTKRKKLIFTQKKSEKALKKLKKSKIAYKKELKKLLKKQNALKKTLAKLNIVKIDKKSKAKVDKNRKKAFDSTNILADKNLPDVKKHGSSYQRVKTKRYKGKKTIAPFSPYTITKRYGNYTDPIYGIKVFNESISLKPSKKNTKVKTVFNGRVIYADKTAVLNNIVIVEHKNGLHTIYANLSQIAPNIRKNKKIKKGYTIGRVSDELIFEVTQKSYHINPVRLFR